MVIIMVVVMAILLSTLISIIVTLITITIGTKEIPLTALITILVKGILILLEKAGHVHQLLRLVVEQELQQATGLQQNLQHHQGVPKVAPLHPIERLHLIGPLHLIEPLHRHRAGHQHQKQQGHHHRVHQIGLLHRDPLHHHALQAQAVHVQVAEEVEDDKFFILMKIKKEAVQNEQPLFFYFCFSLIHQTHLKAYQKHSCL